MTPEKLARLAQLQRYEADGIIGDLDAQELFHLRRELAMAPEVADNPDTLFTDESRRPQLNGTDYNDRLKEICREELRGIALKFGEAAYEVAVSAVVAALKR